MNHLNLIFLTFLLVTLANGFPQSLSEVAVAVKQTDLNYYHSEAPDVMPYENSEDMDHAKLEYEGYGSRIYQLYDGLHEKTSNVFKSKPVVDNIISDSERKGNSGEQLKPLRNIVLGVMSVVSNVINAIVDAPGNILNSAATSLNTGLNKIGGKLVGLM